MVVVKKKKISGTTIGELRQQEKKAAEKKELPVEIYDVKEFGEEKKPSPKHRPVGMWVLVLLLLLAVGVFYYQSDLFAEKQGVVAKVDGQPIHQSAIDGQKEFLLRQLPEGSRALYGSFLTDEMILQALIEEKILMGEAMRLGISTSDEEVSAFIEENIDDAGITLEEYKKSLEDKGASFDDIRILVKKQMTINKLLQEEVYNKIAIDDAALQEQYAKELRAAHILVADNEAAQQILDDLDAGKSFADAAKQYSLDTVSAAKGGDLGMFQEGQMVKEFEDALKLLGVDEVSLPVQTQFGVHIIQRLPLLPFEEIKDQLRSELLAPLQAQMGKEYVDQLKNKSKIVMLKQIESTIGEAKDECIEGYGLSPETIILYITTEDWCAPCKQMAEIARRQSIPLYIAEDGTDTSQVIEDCFSLRPGFPQFVCAGSGKVSEGSLTEQSVLKFAEECKNSS